MLGIFSLFAHLKKNELSHWLTQLLVNIYIGPIQRKQKNDRFLESTKAIKAGRQQRAYGCSWIHWVDSVYPSKPNACRYRLSSLSVCFFLFCRCCCIFIVLLLLLCLVWFFRFLLALLSGILWRYGQMKKDPLQNPHKQRFFAWNVSFFSKVWACNW